MKIHVLIPIGEVRNFVLPPENAEYLNGIGEVEWNPHTRQYTKEELCEICKTAEIIISGWGSPSLWGENLPAETSVKLLVHTAGSVAWLADARTYARGITVCSANEIFAKSVAEGTLAYILAALRNIPLYDREMRAGKYRWSRDYINNALYNKKVGITGYGAVARYLLPLLKPFDVDVYINSGHLSEEDCKKLGARKATIEEVFSECDIISIHNSLTDKTRNMVGKRLLSMIKDGATFINTARGAIVNQVELTEELAKNRFTALLDVFDPEPPEEGSALRTFDNVILMPHMAGPTIDFLAVIGRAMSDEARRFINGEPLLYEIKEESAGMMSRG